MKLYDLKCPHCGAALSTDIKNHSAKCSYCGNEFFISEEDDALKAKQGNNESPDRNGKREEGQNDSGQEAVQKMQATSAETKKESHTFEFLAVGLIVAVGLLLSLFFDKEEPKDIVPKNDLQRFFMELRTEQKPQDIEALAKKYKLHFFRTEKTVNGTEADVIYYKVAQTNETALNMKDAHADTIEIEFDLPKDNTFLWASYADPEHIVSRAVLFHYGTCYSLTAPAAKSNEMKGYYYYNNSLRSRPDSNGVSQPYQKCSNAAEALKKIYTYRK